MSDSSLPPLPPPPLPRLQPPTLAESVLSYASPPALTAALWRDGHLLVTALTSELPDRCVKCNGPADGYRLRKTYYWHPSAWYLMIIFPGILIYAIVAMIIRKKITIGIGLCPMHRSKRKNSLLIGWLLFSFGVLGLIAGIAVSANSRGDDGVIVVLAGVALLFFSALWAIFGVRLLTPRKADKQFAWFSGASPEFMREIPTIR